MTNDNIKRIYIKALRNVRILNPNYKTAKAILGLLTYYSNGSFDDKEFNIDGLDNHPKADVLFDILAKYTVWERVEEENTFLSNGDLYVFTSFKIPKQICDTIKRKYSEEREEYKSKKIATKRVVEKLKEDEINKINDRLNKIL